MIGSMGLASAIGLGLALTDRRAPTVVLDGDGNLLMNLGILPLAAALCPPGFVHVVFDNEVYGSTGSQRSITSGVRLDRLAEAAGYRTVAAVTEAEAITEAAQRYGTEKRVILLHGPVGSSKSTIVRLLKRGLEEYSRSPEGALYTYEWHLPGELARLAGGHEVFACPMHEDPLRLIPADWRERAFRELGLGTPDNPLFIEGDSNPACRQIFRELMAHYKGNWAKVTDHVHVRRMVLSEKDRVGIGTFQPKDEKNQDSTELTGDINYRKIAEYGSDSDPRAFNFDGEFNIANRGIIEF